GIDEQHHRRVDQEVRQVEPVRQRAEELVAEQKAHGHQRPVIIRDSIGALEGPDVGGKDFLQVPEVLEVGVEFDLVVVIEDESVDERIDVRQGTAQNQQDDERELIGAS